ncbi:Dabb family protein [Actinomadura sp. WMMB 499]|uniref:Dabb family protein n=1 Tax=Actinomadura sp. WMMB 499 TaxID=1219491 RepID=UPI001247AD2E|nr:Dabb family protein [Actinomadura sp. WMMB 499]QFG24560.1 Dabb family protein [Actinomadura sp. WMMB 499]
MIYHQVRMAVKPDAPKERVEHALDLMRRLGRELDVVESFLVGRDFGGEFDYGAVYALKDIDAYRTYMYAPLHREIDSAGLPLVSNMVSLDLTDDADPEIGDKIAQVHTDRFKDHPELAGLIDDLGTYEGSGVPSQTPENAG